MDQKHSLSTHHREIRYNIILTHLVLEEPKTRAQLEPTLITFLQWLIHAWLETAMRVDHVEDETRDMWIHQMWKHTFFARCRYTTSLFLITALAAYYSRASVYRLPFF